MIERNNCRQGTKAMEVSRITVEQFVERWPGSELRIILGKWRRDGEMGRSHTKWGQGRRKKDELLDIKFFNWGTGKLTLKSKQNTTWCTEETLLICKGRWKEKTTTHWAYWVLFAPRTFKWKFPILMLCIHFPKRIWEKKKLAIKFPQYKS